MRCVLLLGPPGSGKIMRARALARELSTPTGDDAVALGWLYQRLGTGPDTSWSSLVDGGDAWVPFRAPHHTCSMTGLIGGGSGMYPGEASLAHAGCLLLDELNEFSRTALEPLAHVLQRGEVTIVRRGECITYPARPQLLVATADVSSRLYVAQGSQFVQRERARLQSLLAMFGEWEQVECAPLSLGRVGS